MPLYPILSLGLYFIQYSLWPSLHVTTALVLQYLRTPFVVLFLSITWSFATLLSCDFSPASEGSGYNTHKSRARQAFHASFVPFTSMPTRFRVFIVRHGETEWNRTRRIQGQLDVPLNETGLQQAVLVAEALKDISFARAFSSDLQRASKTAQCILKYHPDTALELDESIRERYMGELQGVVGPSNRPAPSLERTPNFVARTLVWYSRSIIDYMVSMLTTGPPMERSHNILIVSHGGWIVTLLSALQANGLLAYHEDVETGQYLNTGVSIIEYTGGPAGRDITLVGSLVQYSNIDHFEHKALHRREANADVLEDR